MVQNWRELESNKAAEKSRKRDRNRKGETERRRLEALWTEMES